MAIDATIANKGSPILRYQLVQEHHTADCLLSLTWDLQVGPLKRPLIYFVIIIAETHKETTGLLYPIAKEASVATTPRVKKGGYLPHQLSYFANIHSHVYSGIRNKEMIQIDY